MKLIDTIIRDFRKDESGASMVEYGIALIVTAVVGVGAMTALAPLVLAKINAAIAAFG